MTELRDGQLLVEIALSDVPELLVAISPKHLSVSGDRCVVVAPRATATFNGMALERQRGPYAGGDLAYDRDCLLQLAFPGGPVPAAARATSEGRLVIREGRAVWSLTMPDAFTPRRLALVGGVARLTRGQRVTVRWSPASDRITARGVGIGLRRQGHVLELPRTMNGIEVAGDRLSFVVPRDLPSDWTGPIEVIFLGTAFVQPAVQGCPVAGCEVHLRLSVPPIVATLE